MSKTPMTLPTDSPLSPPISRRTVLAGAIAAGTALAAGGVTALGGNDALAATPAAAAPTAEFLKLSEFLTGGKPLAATLAGRYQATLARMDPAFQANAAELQRYVTDARAADIDELLARPDLTEPLKKSITQIVSAWYLGIVGNDQDVELVSYADALMYRPTLDVLVVPSYGGGPDSWGGKPPVSTVPNAVLLAETNDRKS